MMDAGPIPQPPGANAADPGPRTIGIECPPPSADRLKEQERRAPIRWRTFYLRSPMLSFEMASTIQIRCPVSVFSHGVRCKSQLAFPEESYVCIY